MHLRAQQPAASSQQQQRLSRAEENALPLQQLDAVLHERVEVGRARSVVCPADVVVAQVLCRERERPNGQGCTHDVGCMAGGGAGMQLPAAGVGRTGGCYARAKARQDQYTHLRG